LNYAKWVSDAFQKDKKKKIAKANAHWKRFNGAK